MKPFFSIIIPTYNSAQRVLCALKSIKRQTFRNYEVIVIDDGSTDETSTLISPLVNTKVHYVYKNNQGVALARNRGIELAQGDYICFLDADDEYMPDKLELFYTQCLLGHLFLYSDAVYQDENRQISYCFSEFVKVYQGQCFQQLLFNNFIVTSTVCIHRRLLQNQRFNASSFVEDYDLWLKLAYENSLCYINEPLTCYHIHSSNHSKKTRRTIYALTLVYLKWSLTSTVACKQFLKHLCLSFMYLLKVRS